MSRICYGICDRFIKQLDRKYVRRAYINYNKRVIKLSGIRDAYEKGYISCTKCGIHMQKYMVFMSKNGRLMCPCCSSSLRIGRRDL